ncbi:MAG TPA: FtsX-like permease family protein [Rhodocyclaceae bacterium]|nr:FtsX-like permease family protein [Rhodocyclaceae bacterium]
MCKINHVSMFGLVLTMLRRDIRAGELTVLGLALLLAVAALSSVALLADRVERGLAQESHQILGGDLLLSADHSLPLAWSQEAQRRGLVVATSVSFPSMVSGEGGDAQLAEVKAVSANYPLRGQLHIAAELNQPDGPVRRVPAPGSVWLDERLTAALAVQHGSRVRLGNRELLVDAVLTQEPDRGFNLFAIAPRLMLNDADLPSTGLIQPGSRAVYRLHVAAKGADENSAVGGFQRWAQSRLGRGEKLETLDNARPEMRNLLERAQRFLRLAALLAVVLAAVAMGLAADRYMRRHLDAAAVLRVLGASSRQVLIIHGGEFLLFGALVTVAGCLGGYAVQFGLQWLLAGLIRSDLPAPGWQPWIQGLAVGLALVAGFALPPLLRLRTVSTLRVLRREWQVAEPTFLAAWGVGVVTLAALMRWMAGEWLLWGIVLGGFGAAVLIYAVAARLWLALVRRLARMGSQGKSGLGWRYGVANLRRRLRSSLVQAVALGLGLTALLLLTVARDDLMGAWKSKVPADAPNRFAISIQPDQRPEISAFFAGKGLPPPKLEPMVRGRLVAVNGQPISPDSYPDERAKRLVDREFNLSWAASLPASNVIVAGRWPGDRAEPQFSVEQGLAETLGLRLNDRLAYEVAGNRIEAPITSLRKLDWDSMRVNFFVIAPPGVLDDYPASYITSFYLPQGQAGLVPELVRRFPNVTVIDVASVVRQLQDTLDQVARAVQALFGFALLAGLVVLYGALQATADERRYELAVLRALGARGGQLRAVLVTEFLLLGMAAGLLAGAGAMAIATVLARKAFHLDYAPNPILLLYGLLAGIALVLTAGLLGTRRALRTSPVYELRESV